MEVNITDSRADKSRIFDKVSVLNTHIRFLVHPEIYVVVLSVTLICYPEGSADVEID